MTADTVIDKTATPAPNFEDSVAASNARAAEVGKALKADVTAKKPVRKILAGALTIASYTRPDFRVIVNDAAVTVEDVLKPEFWANVGGKLEQAAKQHPFPVIELIWGDASRYMRLLVTDAGPLWARVEVLENKELSGLADAAALDKAAIEASGYFIKRVSPSVGWCVIRESDGEQIRKNLGSKDEAQRELADLVKALKR